MANPQLENGYTQIANEILEALAGINLSPYEGRALFFLIRKTYGWKKKTDWISLSQFSKGLALDRRLVFRALSRLHTKGLVVICRDDKKHPTYGFQKNYDRWQMSDCHKTKTKDLNLERKVKREEKEKASVEMTRVSSVEIPTKETLTKETLKEREERSLLKTFFSLKEVENPKKSEEQRLHEWLIREQAEYVKKHGTEGLETMDWKQYAKTYFRG